MRSSTPGVGSSCFQLELSSELHILIFSGPVVCHTLCLPLFCLTDDHNSWLCVVMCFLDFVLVNLFICILGFVKVFCYSVLLPFFMSNCLVSKCSYALYVGISEDPKPMCAVPCLLRIVFFLC